jgi:hypothetical protein
MSVESGILPRNVDRADSSSGEDAGFSVQKQGFDPPIGYGILLVSYESS